MIQYALECIGFQLLFLIIYDFFLKRETFFQWNRVYLIGTYILSMVLPWIKIEALKTNVSKAVVAYPEYLWNTNATEVVLTAPVAESFEMPWKSVVLFGGMSLALMIFLYKLYQIQQLKQKGEVRYLPHFTRVIIQNSEIAFSFFKSVFLGDKVLEKDYDSIVQHELVHIRQGHSYDLVFFELLRIVNWFNPFVYLYQNRISEVHEFIADAQVAKTHKKEQYQLLLSQVFQTQHISFINPFFKSSLIKKRIVMLQKAKSKKVFQLKYLLLVPLVLIMLLYTSAAPESSLSNSESTSNTNDESIVPKMSIELDEKVADNEQKSDYNAIDKKITGIKSFQIKTDIKDYQDVVDVPFSIVEEVPVFPGCESNLDQSDCFIQKMQEHIRNNFNYPEEAQNIGIQGKVNLMFVIDEKGNVTNLKMRGPHEILETEAKRIISLLPKMAPGKHKGEIVKVPFSMPIAFKLQGEIKETKKDDIISQDAIDVPFSVVEEVPVYPGCEDANDKKACFNNNIFKHIGAHFKYPIEAQNKQIQGKVNVVLKINENGLVENVKMRGPDKLLEAEAARIISLLPEMKPGKQRGKAVGVLFSTPITFKLQ